MSLFAGIMAGSCMLSVPGTDTVDEYGQEIPGDAIVTGPYPCYFFQPRGTVIDLQSGTHQKASMRIMLPAGIAVAVGDTIRGLCIGYEENYAVKSVESMYVLDVLDHWECDLQVVT